MRKNSEDCANCDSFPDEKIMLLILNVMMTTVLENCQVRRDLFILCVIDDGLSLSKAKSTDKRLVVKSNSQSATVEFLTADKEVYQNFLVSDHITTTAYLRISLPSLYKNIAIKRCSFYLDADTLVLDDIVQLWLIRH